MYVNTAWEGLGKAHALTAGQLPQFQPSLKTVILLLFSASSRRLSNTSGCAKASPAVINLFILMKRVDAY